MLRFIEPEEIRPLLKQHLVSDLVPLLFDLHKQAPDLFVVAKRDLFEYLHKQAASPIEMYWAMVACKVAKQKNLSMAALLLIDLDELMPSSTHEKPERVCDDAKINQPQPDSPHYQRLAEDLPNALELKVYDV
jgi:hypothetical protein